MKRFNILLIILFFSFTLFAQGLSGITKITTHSDNSSTQITVYFSESINPRTVNSNSIFINGNPINSNTKFIYNREGTQVRFNIPIQDSFSIQFIHLITNSGKEITTDLIYLSGDQNYGSR